MRAKQLDGVRVGAKVELQLWWWGGGGGGSGCSGGGDGGGGDAVGVGTDEVHPSQKDDELDCLLRHFRSKKIEKGEAEWNSRDDAFIYLLHSTPQRGPNHGNTTNNRNSNPWDSGVGDTSKMMQFYSLGCFDHHFRSLFRSHSVMQLLPSPPLPRMRPPATKTSRFLLIKHAHAI